MREIVQQQPELTPVFIAHGRAAELRAMQEILRENPEIFALVHSDLTRGGADPRTGRKGMAAEQVVGALIIKQMEEYSYEELAFHLADSRTFRSFCCLPALSDETPGRSTLHDNIKKLQPATLEAINRILVGIAKHDGLEKGRKIRVDCTTTESNIHKPSDSWLLWDCVRVLTRLMHQAVEVVGEDVRQLFMDHSRRAKRRFLAAHRAKSKKARKQQYRDLLKVTARTSGYAEQVAAHLERFPTGIKSIAIELELKHYIGLTERVIEQTRRRVLEGEAVPASEKVVSIFEPHTDIIRKAPRETEFGHKLCLTVGVSSMVLDCTVLDGNPADATLAKNMVERQKELYGRPPRQVAFDGGFASSNNVTDIKAIGVKDVVFHKKRGIEISAMAKSTWVYNRLRRFRAGIEGVISFLKRCFGLDRCTWSGKHGFKKYVWSSIVSANLLMLARHRIANAKA